MDNKARDKIDLIIKENSDVWKTQAELFSWVRGGIRGRSLE